MSHFKITSMNNFIIHRKNKYIIEINLPYPASPQPPHREIVSENRNLVGTSLLSRLRPGSLLINAARGKIVDTPALADWAQTSADHGCRAVLDVLDPEPPAADCPLFGLDNVKILPHLASRTHTGLANMSWVVRDIWSVIQDESPKYPCLPGNVS